jgi:multidrug resistance efflux pump
LGIAQIAYGRALKESPRLAAQWRQQRDARRAEVDMYEMLLDEATIRASQPGVVLEGDWMERQGARVDKGTRLFNVAPLGKLRVVIHVDERDIDRVKVTSTGELAAQSAPSESIGFTVTRIVPMGRLESVGDARRVQNVFDVYAVLDALPEGVQVLPGMKGAAKIDAGRQRVIWIMTHKLVDYLRLAFWW